MLTLLPQALHNPDLKARHYERMAVVLGTRIDQDDAFTVSHLLDPPSLSCAMPFWPCRRRRRRRRPWRRCCGKCRTGEQRGCGSGNTQTLQTHATLMLHLPWHATLVLHARQ